MSSFGKPFIPIKVKAFLRFACRNAILTKDNLVRRRWQGPNSCVLCNGAIETVNHVLLLSFPLANLVLDHFLHLLAVSSRLVVMQDPFSGWPHLLVPKRDLWIWVLVATVNAASQWALIHCILSFLLDMSTTRCCQDPEPTPFS